MIQVVCLNPAVDRTMVVGTLRPGEVHRGRLVAAMAGGKGMNVARFLKQMQPDLEVRVTGFVGGHGGALIRAACEQDGAVADLVEISEESRVCYTIVEDGRGEEAVHVREGEMESVWSAGASLPQSQAKMAEFAQDVASLPLRSTVLNESGPGIDDAAMEQFWGTLRADARLVVVSGSAPDGYADLHAEIVRHMQRAGVPVLVDAAGETLARAVTAAPAIIKPNETEFARLLRDLGAPAQDACPHADRVSIPAAGEPWDTAIGMSRWIQGAGVRNIVVSFGALGAVWVSQDDIWIAPALTVPVLNAVGCGDALVAGICLGTLWNDPERGLRHGIAASAMNAMNLLPRLNRPDLIPGWASLVPVRRLSGARS